MGVVVPLLVFSWSLILIGVSLYAISRGMVLMLVASWVGIALATMKGLAVSAELRGTRWEPIWEWSVVGVLLPVPIAIVVVGTVFVLRPSR